MSNAPASHHDDDIQPILSSSSSSSSPAISHHQELSHNSLISHLRSSMGSNPRIINLFLLLVIIILLLVILPSLLMKTSTNAAASSENNNGAQSTTALSSLPWKFSKPQQFSETLWEYFAKFQTQASHALNFLVYHRTLPVERPYAVNYHVDAQNSIRRITLETLMGKVSNPKLVIVSQLFGRDREGHHYHDMLTAIQANLLNPLIAEYHFLQEDDFNNEDLLSLINSEKVKIHNLGRRLSAADFMEYCNEHLRYRYVTLTNTDIYFDTSVIHVKKIQNNTSLILSRRQTFITDYLEGENRDHCLGGYVGSHDVFMYRTDIPFPKDAIEKLRPVHLGYYGTENVIMFYTKSNKDFGYQVRNPCQSIFVWHLHERRSGGANKRINDDSNSSLEDPNDLYK